MKSVEKMGFKSQLVLVVIQQEVVKNFYRIKESSHRIENLFRSSKEQNNSLRVLY